MTPDDAPAPDPSPGSPPGAPSHPQAVVLRRLFALVYDALPVLALWMVVGALFTAGYTLAGHPVRENIKPFSALQWIEWLCCWLLTGAYAVLSWRRGGQTLGMRPWRLRVVAPGGGAAGLAALARRYALGTLSLLLAGAGFWWAWFDRDRLALHDRLSGTRMQLAPKRPRS